MSTATTPAEPVTARVSIRLGEEQRFLIRGISWSRYVRLLEIFGDDGPRITYSEGMLEFMSPGFRHEEVGGIIGRMIEMITEELDIPLKAAGQTTLKREDVAKGLEGDRAFYLENAHRLTSGQDLILETTPPPDLVVEVQITSALINKLAIYAVLGVPEIWRYDGKILRVPLLQPDRTYRESPRSRALPLVPMAEMGRKLDEIDPTNDTRWARAGRAWVRAVVAPLYQP